MRETHTLNLRRLEHLVAVAEEGSLAAAARRVHLSQPALTRSIQALEAEAGMALVDRSARGVTLTAAGKMATERARRILFETRCLARDLMLTQQHEMGGVEFGVGPFSAATLLPEVLCALQRDWPKLRVKAVVGDGPALFAALRAEQLDFVVVDHRTIPVGEDLEARRLAREEVGCFARRNHPLGRRDVSVAQIHEAVLVSVLFPDHAREQLRKALRCRPGENVPFQVESNDVSALAYLASRSDAVLIAPKRALATQLRSGDLVQLSVPDMRSMVAQFSIARLTPRTLSPAAERAVAAFVAVV